MLKTIKVVLMVVLLAGTLMADGQMGSGGRGECTENCPPPPCTENCGRPIEAESDPFAVKLVKTITKLYFVRF